MAQRYVDAIREAYRSVVRKDIKGVFGSIFPEAVRLAAERIAAHHPQLSGDVIYQDLLRRFRFYIEPIPHEKLAHVDEEREHVLLNLRAVKDFLRIDGHGYRFAKRREGHRIARVRHIIREALAEELEKWHLTHGKVTKGESSIKFEDELQHTEPELSHGVELALLVTPILLLATAAFNMASLAERNMSGMAVGTASSFMGAVFLFLAVLVAAHTLRKE